MSGREEEFWSRGGKAKYPAKGEWEGGDGEGREEARGRKKEGRKEGRR